MWLPHVQTAFECIKSMISAAHSVLYKVLLLMTQTTLALSRPEVKVYITLQLLMIMEHITSSPAILMI